MRMLLNDLNWKLKGFWPYVPFMEKSVEIQNDLMGVTDWINSTVPGGVHADLLLAGYIDDPYVDFNSINCEWVENRWWLYKSEFIPDIEYKGKNIKLVFEGVDYLAHFYFNGKKICSNEGMFVPVILDVTSEIKFSEKNEVEVLIESPPDEMGQIGYTSKTRSQKSRFGYKWDFGTRLVNIGIWKDVYLEINDDVEIEDRYIRTDYINNCGIISVRMDIKKNKEADIKSVLSIKDPDGEIVTKKERDFKEKVEKVNYEEKITIQDPCLWHPNGYGCQPLYTVSVSLYVGNKVEDEFNQRIGIRSISYKKNGHSPPQAPPYTICINKIPVYIKGVNITPFDHMYGTVRREDYEIYINLLKKSNVNLVRVWGGGIYETDDFYELCDENGILIWQDFLQSSSGIENIPSTDEHFINLMKKNAEYVVKTKRNHVSLAIWSGGNELTDKNNMPITNDNPNIKILEEIVKSHDPGRLFVPTSGYGPGGFLNIDEIGSNYDVHGRWKYEGQQEHYKTYNHSDCLLHSEFGVDGCSHFMSLKKFLSKENYKLTNMKDNLVWRHHGEWWDTYERDVEFFKKFVSLEQFTLASQLIQAEGIRYILESNARRIFQNSGSIIWQLNEPWPNVSCTSLIDYYKNPKMAYYWVKKSYQPIHVSLKYNKLSFPQNQSFEASLYANSTNEEISMAVSFEILDVFGTKIFEESVHCILKRDESKKLKSFKLNLREVSHGIFFVRIMGKDMEGKHLDDNLYLFSQYDKHIFSGLLEIPNSQIDITQNNSSYRIRNNGNVVCLFFHAVSDENENRYFIRNNYATIFPNEECEIYPERIDGQRLELSNSLKFFWLNQ